MTADLRPCIAHRKPINRCAHCFPLFLAELGHRCAVVILERQRAAPFVPRESLSRPTIAEQRVFAKQLRMQ